MSLLYKNDRELDFLVKSLIKGSILEESAKDRSYMSDSERREMVKKLRAVEKEGEEAKKEGDSRLYSKKWDEAHQIVEKLFAEVELLIYDLANSMTSGPLSRKSFGTANFMNDAEDLKAAGVKEFLRCIEGGTYTDSSGSRTTGFNPDGPGTFNGFIYKCVRGAMLNCHTKEKKHRENDVSFDAPAGGDDENDSNLYNNVFADSNLRFDVISDDDSEAFEKDAAYDMLIKCLDDITSNQRDKEIFKDYWGVEGHKKLTPTQIGEKFGFSKQRANNIIQKLMDRMRTYIKDEVESLNESAAAGHFIVKIGKSFFAGEKMQKTRNLDKASKFLRKEAEAVARYWNLLGNETSVVPQNGPKAIKESSTSGEPHVETTLDGMNLRQARTRVNKIWNALNLNGIYSDDSWRMVYKFWDALRDNGVFSSVIGTEYRTNTDGNPHGKVWKVEFPFINQNGKEAVITGNLVASGAGTVEYPLSKYDLCFSVF